MKKHIFVTFLSVALFQGFLFAKTDPNNVDEAGFARWQKENEALLKAEAKTSESKKAPERTYAYPDTNYLKVNPATKPHLVLDEPNHSNTSQSKGRLMRNRFAHSASTSDDLDSKLDDLQSELESRLDDLDSKIDDLQSELESRLDDLDSKIDDLEHSIRMLELSR